MCVLRQACRPGLLCDRQHASITDSAVSGALLCSIDRSQCVSRDIPLTRRHKSYHPYLEKNKQRVREDEAKARAEEEEREAARVDSESRARMDVLRRRAGSPGVRNSLSIDNGTAQKQVEAEDNLPSTSSSKPLEGGGLMERHRKAKARAEKEEKKRRERLDFDFPSETARKEKRREEKEKERERMAGSGGATGSYDYDENGRESQSLWVSGGHLNLFADLERVSSSSSHPALTAFCAGRF